MKGIQRCGGSANSPRLSRASEILHTIFHSLSMTLSRAVLPISDFFVPVSLRRRCRLTSLHISSRLMSRAYPSSPLEARLHRLIQVWKLDLVERGCFIYLDPNLSTHESSCSDSILSGGTRHDTRPSICVGRWQFVYSTSSKQLSVHSSLTHGYSRKFSSYSFRSGAETAGAAAGLSVPLIHVLGRGASDAYCPYIRTLPDILSRAMAGL